MIRSWLLGALLVRMLPLPTHATIEPFGARSLMAVARNGAVAATVTFQGFLNRIVVWDVRGKYRLLPVDGTVSAYDADGALVVNGTRPQRADGARVSPIDLRMCENFPQASVGATIAGYLSDGSLIATMQSPPIVDLDDTSGQNAPVVLHLRSDLCLNMGNGVALATAGLYSAGYAASINNVPAPSNVVSSKERFVAMRWRERTREPLGPGAALAIAASGDAAGADLPPGGVAYNASPHARAWLSNGSVVDVAPDAPLSVAYAIDDRGRIAGMLEDAAHHHYAFLWERGRLRRLDDLAGATGWRFECAYAFASDGSIVGVGTYRSRAAAFSLSGL